MLDCKNYVITHRDYPIIEDDMYRALCVGGFRKDGWLCAADGENIEQYNGRINELTGLYWIWKNTGSEYAGLSHYRRYFQNCGHRLDLTGVEDILVNDGNDIILSPIRLGWPVHDNLRQAVGSDLSVPASRIVLDLISRRRPDYVDAFMKVMAGNRMYLCNMFVTRREIMNRYCEWLFSFMPDAADRIQVDGETGFRKRTAGYLGEIMLTVWMERQDLRVYELPLEVVK